MSLSPHEIDARMIELRNLRRLHAAQKVRIGIYKAQNKKLKERVTVLEVALSEQLKINADVRLQLEEMRTIVFGRKRKKDDDRNDVPPFQTGESPPRTPESYKRRIPEAHEVTETKNHTVDTCTHCHSTFSERESVTYFVEDIPLPQKRIVIKHTVEKGYCAVCRKWSTSHPLPCAPVVLGGNVKRYVAYLSVVARQSYSQTRDLLKQTYDFDISEGEIAKILEKEGKRLRPAYERLKASIRGEPSVHLDETGWNLFMTDGYRRYAWTMVGGTSADMIFVLGKTRGKGNADDLLGDSKATTVTDDYAAYRCLEHPHQLRAHTAQASRSRTIR